MSLRLSLTVLVPALLVAGCDSEPEPAVQQQDELTAQKPVLIGEPDYSLAGAQLPGLTVVDARGEELSLASLKGQPVLLNLWATWCVPCITEMPALDELAGQMGDEVKVLTISQDLTGASVVEPFFAERDFRHLEPWLDQTNETWKAVGGNVLPVTVLFNAEGEEIFRVRGGYDWSSEEAIALVRESITE